MYVTLTFSKMIQISWQINFMALLSNILNFLPALLVYPGSISYIHSSQSISDKKNFALMTWVPWKLWFQWSFLINNLINKFFFLFTYYAREKGMYCYFEVRNTRKSHKKFQVENNRLED